MESGTLNELNQYQIHQCCNNFHKHWKSAITVRRSKHWRALRCCHRCLMKLSSGFVVGKKGSIFSSHHNFSNRQRSSFIEFFDFKFKFHFLIFFSQQIGSREKMAKERIWVCFLVLGLSHFVLSQSGEDLSKPEEEDESNSPNETKKGKGRVFFTDLVKLNSPMVAQF